MKVKKWIASLATALFVGSLLSASAMAQQWPSAPIRLICPFPPGAGVDISARIVAEALSKRLGVAVVVENRAGAGGTIGMDYVAHASPDGYTLGWPAGDAITMVPAFKKTVSYRVPDDFAFVAKFVETGLSIAVRKDLPASDVRELVSYAKAHPDEIKSGTSGVGSGSDIVTYLFAKATGTQIAHIPYKGQSAAVADLLGGHIDVIFATPSVVEPLQKAGNARILAVTSNTRVPQLPDVPTVAELGLAGMAFSNWYGMVAPPKTPTAIVDRLQKEIGSIAEDKDVRAKLEKAALDVAVAYGKDFEQQVVKGLDMLKALGKSENIVIE